MLLGLRSYWYAGSLGCTGKTPVAWSRGRSLVTMVRVPLVVDMVKLESHLTLPWTATFLLMSYSVLLFTNHGPRACAPPPPAGARHTYTKPLAGASVLYFPSPTGRIPSAYSLP